MTSLPLALFDVGTPELLLIFVAVLLLFGGQRLPELAKGLGKSIREFKKASAGVEEEIKRAIDAAPDSSHRTLPAPALSDVNRSTTLPSSTPAAIPPTESAGALPEAPKPPFDSSSLPKG